WRRPSSISAGVVPRLAPSTITAAPGGSLENATCCLVPSTADAHPAQVIVAASIKKHERNLWALHCNGDFISAPARISRPQTLPPPLGCLQPPISHPILGRYRGLIRFFPDSFRCS